MLQTGRPKILEALNLHEFVNNDSCLGSFADENEPVLHHALMMLLTCSYNRSRSFLWNINMFWLQNKISMKYVWSWHGILEYPHLGVLLHFSTQSLKSGSVQAQLAFTWINLPWDGGLYMFGVKPSNRPCISHQSCRRVRFSLIPNRASRNHRGGGTTDTTDTSISCLRLL